MCCAGRIASQKFVCADIFPGKARVCALCGYSFLAFLKVCYFYLTFLLLLPLSGEAVVVFVTCFPLLSSTNFSVSHRPCPSSMYSGHNGVFMLNDIILSGRRGLLQRMLRQLQRVIMLCKPWDHMYNQCFSCEHRTHGSQFQDATGFQCFVCFLYFWLLFNALQELEMCYQLIKSLLCPKPCCQGSVNVTVQ